MCSLLVVVLGCDSVNIGTDAGHEYDSVNAERNCGKEYVLKKSAVGCKLCHSNSPNC